jgi:hypothetical protein
MAMIARIKRVAGAVPPPASDTRITEISDRRITESGDVRVIE